MEVSEPIILGLRESFAAYSLPNQTDHVLIRGQVTTAPLTAGGFAIESFDKEHKDTCFISADEIWHDVPFSFQPNESCALEETSKTTYLDYARETIDQIRSGGMEKVVMSRVKLQSRSSDSDKALYDLFDALKFAYPKAFVFLYHAPDIGCWCGATPEILMSQAGDIFRTVALAGTQADSGMDLSSVTWGTKEQREQAIIEGYIKNILSDENISSRVIGPETVKAGEVLHIQTTFEMTAVDDPLRLAQKMHPGPAICGVPLNASLSWIKGKEPHDRVQYCGYIGPWGIEGTSALYINLRSMRVYSDYYALFVGGGLTRDSKAIDEWEETELKTRTLLTVIRQSVLHG